MTFTRSLLFPLVIYFALQANASKFISEKLVNHILKHSNPNVIPQTALGSPVNVTVSLSLINIRDVDFTTKDVMLDAWLNLRWESGLTFDPENFGGLSNVRLPGSAVWRPDIEVYNGRMTFPSNEANQVIASSIGSMLWVPKVDIRITCDVKDSQIFSNTTCHVKMGSWVYSADYIHLESDPTFEVANFAVDGSSFELLNVTATKQTLKYECCENYEDIKFVFSFKKKSC